MPDSIVFEGISGGTAPGGFGVADSGLDLAALWRDGTSALGFGPSAPKPLTAAQQENLAWQAANQPAILSALEAQRGARLASLVRLAQLTGRVPSYAEGVWPGSPEALELSRVLVTDQFGRVVGVRAVSVPAPLPANQVGPWATGFGTPAPAPAPAPPPPPAPVVAAPVIIPPPAPAATPPPPPTAGTNVFTGGPFAPAPDVTPAGPPMVPVTEPVVTRTPVPVLLFPDGVGTGIAALPAPDVRVHPAFTTPATQLEPTAPPAPFATDTMTFTPGGNTDAAPLPAENLGEQLERALEEDATFLPITNDIVSDTPVTAAPPPTALVQDPAEPITSADAAAIDELKNQTPSDGGGFAFDVGEIAGAGAVFGGLAGLVKGADELVDAVGDAFGTGGGSGGAGAGTGTAAGSASSSMFLILGVVVVFYLVSRSA